MVLGESPIFGQIKVAYNQELDSDSIKKYLGRLFQHTFTVVKLVRTDTYIGNILVSVSFTAISLAKQILNDFTDVTALLMDVGKTVKFIARHLRDNWYESYYYR